METFGFFCPNCSKEEAFCICDKPEKPCAICGVQSFTCECTKKSVEELSYLPEDTELSNTQQMIAKVVEEIKELLLDKNRKYGDSAINPVRIFSKADALEQINVRIDDKLSRIMSSQSDEDEDVEKDLIGYLVLKEVKRRLNAEGPLRRKLNETL